MKNAIPENGKTFMNDHPNVPENFTFVITVNDKQVCNRNALASPDLKNQKHEVLLRFGYATAGSAYNSAILDAKHDVIIFIHQDMYLPPDWTMNLRHILAELAEAYQPWGVLGCYGVTHDKKKAGQVFCNGQNRVLGRAASPVPVQSLDECCLIINRENGISFDAKLPHFHLYGTDICLEAETRGLINYAISNFCIHNTRYIRRLPPEFWTAARYVRQKWKRQLPIQTCCATIWPPGPASWLARLKYEVKAWRNPKCIPKRLADPAVVLKSCTIPS